MKKIVVNVATYGREDYPQAQDRLIYNFTENSWDGDYMMFSDKPRLHEKQVMINDIIGSGIRPNSEVPYAFKPDSMRKAALAGYTKIMWCDSTIMMLKNLDPLFEIAAERGVVAFHNLGHDLNDYISDYAADQLGILDKLKRKISISQIMACCIIFDLDNDKGNEIFTSWFDSSYHKGMFENSESWRPEFKAHRHDQAILSGLLYQHDIELCRYGMLVYEPHDRTKEFGDPFLLNKGL